MSLKSTEIAGRIIKAFLILVLITTYYDTSYIGLILITLTYMGISEDIYSKRFNAIKKKLDIDDE